MEYINTSCKFRMSVETVLGILLLINVGTLTTAQTSCGTLKNSVLGSTVTIRLLPDPALENVLMLGRTYRWIVAKDGQYTGVTIDARVTATNLTLRIAQFGLNDVGVYYVQCQNLQGNTIESDRVNLGSPDVTSHIPVSSTTSTTTITSTYTSTTTLASENTTVEGGTTTGKGLGGGDPLNISQDEIDESIAIVIVSLCVVIIVVVISGTIILVCRRRKQRAEDHQRLAEMTESSMTSRMAGDGESVYNEIDLQYDTTNLSKSKAQGIADSREFLRSPTLPRRPETAGQHDDPVSEKSTANVISTSPSNENAYAEMADMKRQSKSNTALTVDVKSMYATVVPKKYRINKDVTLPQEYMNMNPTGRKGSYPPDQADGANAEGYSVMFPKIDMSQISTKVTEQDKRKELVSMTEENFESVCKSRVYRSQKRQGSKRKLNYIEVDHSAAGSVGPGGAAGSSDDVLVRPFVKAPREQLEYSSIDFEKKAFVAPTRRPPSSWYKRKNNKKKY